MLSLLQTLYVFDFLQVFLFVLLVEHLHPLVVESLFAAEPLFGLAYQMLDQVFCFFGHGFPFFAVKVVFAFDHESQDFLVVVSAESRVATQKSVQDAPSSPQVTLLVIVSRQNLW